MPKPRWAGGSPVTSLPARRISPRSGVSEAGQEAQGGGFAAAREAEQGEDLAFGGERDRPSSTLTAVAPVPKAFEPAQLEQGAHSPRPRMVESQVCIHSFWWAER